MAALAHSDMQPTFLKLDAYQAVNFNLGGNVDSIEDILYKHFATNNPVVVLDVDLLDMVIDRQRQPLAMDRLVVHAKNHKPLIQLTNVDPNNQTTFYYIAKSICKVAGLPLHIRYATGEAFIYNDEVLPQVQRSVLDSIYNSRFSDGHEFTAMDIVELLPDTEGVGAARHSSAIGLALKSISVKNPHLLTFRSRMVESPNPRIKNRSVTYYSVHNDYLSASE